jgi:hypothetical protein
MPPFILLVHEVDGVWCYTIYTDRPAHEAKQMKQTFEETYARLYGSTVTYRASFALAPMSALPPEARPQE